MIEFAAVVQEVLATQKASTLVLDIAADDLTVLADLIDEEVMITITPRTSSSEPPIASPRKKRNRPSTP